jgi:hypothetical protein
MSWAPCRQTEPDAAKRSDRSRIEPVAQRHCDTYADLILKLAPDRFAAGHDIGLIAVAC